MVRAESYSARPLKTSRFPSECLSCGRSRSALMEVIGCLGNATSNEVSLSCRLGTRPPFSKIHVRSSSTCRGWRRRVANGWLFRWQRMNLQDCSGAVSARRSLRHSCASAMIASSAPITKVQHRLGHANPAITLLVYSHFLKHAESDVADRLADAVLIFPSVPRSQIEVRSTARAFAS